MANLLDPILNPLTNYSPALIITIFSLVLAFLSVIIYKLTTNQKYLKELRRKTEKIQKKIRELQKDITSKEAQKEMGKLNTELMLISGEQMKASMRSTIFTIIPFLLLFGWLAAHYSYEPLLPNQPFNITVISQNNIKNLTLESTPKLELINESFFIKHSNNNDFYVKTFTVKGQQGDYLLEFKLNNNLIMKKDIIITTRHEYTNPKETTKDKKTQLIISNKPLRINILNFSLSWFWYYFIIITIFSTLFRKILKVY